MTTEQALAIGVVMGAKLATGVEVQDDGDCIDPNVVLGVITASIIGLGAPGFPDGITADAIRAADRMMDRLNTEFDFALL